MMPLISTAPAGSMDTSAPIGPFPPDYPALWVFASAILLGLLVNIWMFSKTVRHGILTTGAWVSHVGICLMLAGVLITSVFSKSTEQPLQLAKGQSGEAFGYQVKYLGLTKGSAVEGDRDHLRLELSRGKERLIARIPYYQAKMPNGQEQLITNPAIRKYWDHDLYISTTGQSDGTDGAELMQGQSAHVAGYTIKFLRFDVSGIDRHGADKGAPIEAKAVVEVTKDGTTSTLRPAYIVSPNDTQRIPAMMPGGDFMMSVFKIVPETGSVQLLVVPMTPTDMAGIEVSHKPYVNVLWLGGVLMGLGPLLAWRRRVLLARKAVERWNVLGPATESAPPVAPRRGRPPQRRPAPVTASSKR
jgi:cytochrome c biogenesis factor